MQTPDEQDATASGAISCDDDSSSFEGECVAEASSSTVPAATAAASPQRAPQQARDAVAVRRLRKWRKMLGAGTDDWEQYAARHPERVRRRVAAGIPDRLRGVAWQLLSGGRRLLLQNEGVYEGLLLLPPRGGAGRELEIVRDLSRTYPAHVYYARRQGPGQRALYNLLKAYCTYDDRLGYVQGMGFLAGLLLLYMCEEDAFWCLVALLRGGRHAPLEGLYTPGLPLLHKFTHVFGRLVEEQLPELAAHLAAEGVAPGMYASQWFLTLFAATLPFEHLARVWDVFLLDGMKPLFQVGLSLLSLLRVELLDAPFDALLGTLSGKRVGAALPHSPDTLLATARRFRIGRRLGALMAEYDRAQSGSAPPQQQAASHSGEGASTLSPLHAPSGSMLPNAQQQAAPHGPPSPLRPSPLPAPGSPACS